MKKKLNPELGESFSLIIVLELAIDEALHGDFEKGYWEFKAAQKKYEAAKKDPKITPIVKDSFVISP